MSIRKITALALFTTMSLAVFAIESAIPPLVPIPGIKLGLANIITLVVLTAFSAKDAFCVLMVRILLSAVLFGQAMSLLYSLAGGICCFLVMLAASRLLQGHFLYLTSALGAVAHNLGQLLVAYLLTSVPGVLVYLPFLLLGGIITGLFTGFCAQFTLHCLMPLTARLPFSPKSDDDN